MNRHRFKSDMEAAWELRPLTDMTPETCAHPRRNSEKSKAIESKSEKKPEEKA